MCCRFNSLCLSYCIISNLSDQLVLWLSGHEISSMTKEAPCGRERAQTACSQTISRRRKPKRRANLSSQSVFFDLSTREASECSESSHASRRIHRRQNQIDAKSSPSAPSSCSTGNDAPRAQVRPHLLKSLDLCFICYESACFCFRFLRNSYRPLDVPFVDFWHHER